MPDQLLGWRAVILMRTPTTMRWVSGRAAWSHRRRWVRARRPALSRARR